MMIDNNFQTMELMEKIETRLPISVFPTKPLIQTMRESGIRLTSQKMLTIEKIRYMGDEGGIMCLLGGTGIQKELFVCSLTHLRISPRHPLFKEIHAYQRERKNKLAQQS